MCHQDKKAGLTHKQEHRRWTRRSFLSQTSLFAGVSVMLSQFPVQVLARNPLGNLEKANQDNILVLLQLKGGNDGLNTIIPFYDFGTYKTLRKRIHIPKKEAIPLNKDFGMHHAMQPLKSLWDKGMMKIIPNVGYPNPNLSHFRSSDVWMSASGTNKIVGTGWMGRYLDQTLSSRSTLDTPYPPAISIGEVNNLIFQGKTSQFLMQIEDPQELYETMQSGETFAPVGGDSKYNQELQFIRNVCNDTRQYAKAIQAADAKGKTAATYTNQKLHQQLQQVAKLIKGGLGTKVYLVTLDGFDTHAGQTWKHSNLLEQLSKGISAFYEDLSTQNLQHKVTTMTFSEFGRRMEENSSGGTDHGTSAPVLLFGGGLGENKIVGEPANLKQSDDNGNLMYSTDFRAVYASVLQDWMGVSPKGSRRILGGKFTPISGLF